MGLTQVNTDGVKDDAVTLAKQAAGTDGQVITYDASGNPKAIGPGTDGQVLTSAGAGAEPAFEDAVSEGTQVKSTGESGGTKFLREDGDGTSSWQTVPPGTSLTGSTDNTVVTVTGANALAGEANLTFDGNNLKVGAGASTHADADDLVVSKDAAISGISIQNADAGYGCLNFGDASDNDIGRIAYAHSTDSMKFNVNTATRVEIDSQGATTFQNGHLGSIGGGVVVCAAASSSGDSADSPNFKVDFTVPVANVSANYNAELKRGFNTGETGKNAELNVSGSGILIATCGGSYYWGFATKIYHLTIYGNGSSNASSLNELHSYSGQGHSSNASAVTLAVQSIAHSTPTIRATFGGDYWNSNKLNVTWIGHSVASPSMIRPNAMTGTHGHANWTGQDPTWK